MKIEHENGTNSDAVGFVNLGTHLVARTAGQGIAGHRAL